MDDLAVRADEGAAAVQGIPVALNEAEGDGGIVLSGGVLQLADGGGIKWESHIAVSGVRPAQAVEALEGGFAEHNKVGTISGDLGDGGGHGSEVMRNVFVPDRGGGEGDSHRCVSSIRGGSAAIRSRPFGATMCKELGAQVGGASEDARS